MTTSTQSRMEVDEYFIKMARLASCRGACVRRQVGCVLVNNLNHVIATGYNGRARGVTNCLEEPCDGATLPSGTGLERCEAIHAEANALLQCPSVQDISTAYCTASPCIHCVKLLENTGCERIVFSEKYPGHEESERIWKRLPWRKWEMFNEQFEIFADEIGPQCEHRNWRPSTRQTRSDDTVYRECVDCGLIKEVCT